MNLYEINLAQSKLVLAVTQVTCNTGHDFNFGFDLRGILQLSSVPPGKGHHSTSDEVTIALSILGWQNVTKVLKMKSL
jgi:hypothetical protein